MYRPPNHWDLAAIIAKAAGNFPLSGLCTARSALLRAGPAAHQQPSILLSGLSRIGKSGLAQFLARRLGHRHVQLDRCVRRMYSIREAGARSEFRNRFYGRLLARARTGYVIEGDDLVLADRWYHSGCFGQEPLDPGCLAELSRSFDVVAVVLGSADSPIESLIRSLELDHKWRRTHPERERRAYAEYLKAGSQRLRDLVAGGPVHYLEVDPANRAASLSACVDRIMQLLP